MMRFAFALLSAGMLLGTAPAPREHQVTITGMKFTPASLIVRPGDTVVWKNDDLVPHNVVGQGFASPVMNSGASFRWIAQGTGDLPYQCTLHPMMKATLVVSPR